MTLIPAKEIIEFWFSECDAHPEQLQSVAGRWYSGAVSFDKEIVERFGHLFDLVPEPLMSALDTLNEDELLAAILLCDQYSRNCFRRSAKAFQFDDFSLRLLDVALAKGLHLSMHPIYCVFLLMPLQHAEDLSRQEQGLKLFEALEARASEPYRSYIENTARYARDHHELIAQFGRFPHRNEVLGREPSQEERDYLSAGGKRFGQ
ncbi:Uncharacterized conserved protein, DUF924 family [Alteromonadaceae bacterium Bs31]|nr:Uncharacterized conserved protein, DUF924 family [Alteromonadaceae bacterium Bs31]